MCLQIYFCGFFSFFPINTLCVCVVFSKKKKKSIDTAQKKYAFDKICRKKLHLVTIRVWPNANFYLFIWDLHQIAISMRMANRLSYCTIFHAIICFPFKYIYLLFFFSCGCYASTFCLFPFRNENVNSFLFQSTYLFTSIC